MDGEWFWPAVVFHGVAPTRYPDSYPEGTPGEHLLAVGVFGSYGRGDAGVGSDLDLVLVLRECAEPIWDRLRRWDTGSLPLKGGVRPLYQRPRPGRPKLAPGSISIRNPARHRLTSHPRPPGLRPRRRPDRPAGGDPGSPASRHGPRPGRAGRHR